MNFENDFADLAARFSAISGGGLTAELSADLALEIVLNEIVEQACRVTGATGAAIVLERDGEMVCRASSGATAPELGARIDTQSGLAGECLKSLRTQCCDDALSDPRADVEASERLGVRSVVVMPLKGKNGVLGLFELFSPQTFAFGVRDERVLEVLADRTVENLERASRLEEPGALAEALEFGALQSLQPEPQEALEPEPRFAQGESPQFERIETPRKDVRSGPDRTTVAASAEAAFEEATFEKKTEGAARPSSRNADLVLRFLGIAVVAAAVLLGVALGRHFTSSRAAVAKQVAAPVAPGPITPADSIKANSTPTPRDETSAIPSRQKENGNAVSGKRLEVPPGGLMVFERGKEVYRSVPGEAPATTDTGNAVQLAAERTTEQSQEPFLASPEREVIHRVNPEYPQAAREQGIEGKVVLEVHIGADGEVQGVQVMSGAPALAQASIDAVKQWKFKPSVVDGRAAEMQTRITLNFKLQG